MAKSIRYRFCGSEDRQTFDFGDLHGLIQQLSTPKASLITNPEGLAGYLDFHVSDDKSIEMELCEHSDDDFATIDIVTASRVIEIAMTDIRDMPLRQKLEGLPIHWIT